MTPDCPGLLEPAFLDFETYYCSQTYTLKRMTIEEYVRDRRFEAIGVSVAIGRGAPVWHTGEAIAPVLHAAQLPHRAVVAHNAGFDGFILSERYGLHPAELFCTLDMARPLHGTRASHSLAALAERYGLPPKGTAVVDADGKRAGDFTPQQLAAYGVYCAHDTFLCRELFGLFKRRYPLDELRILSQTIQAFTRPQFQLDIPVLDAELDRLAQYAAGLTSWLCTRRGATPAQIRALIMSGPKLAQALEALGVDVPMKLSKTAKLADGTPKPTHAFAKTDEEFVAMQDDPDEEVAALVTARLGGKSTIKLSRTTRFREIASRGPLPVPLRYQGARASGRWSGTEKLNLQNLSKERDPAKPQEPLRVAMRAPPGYAVLAADSAQIEARVLPWLAGQRDVVRAYAEGRDGYLILASAIFKRAVTAIDKWMRQVGKVARLSLGFGGGKVTMRTQLRKLPERIIVADAEAQGYVDVFRQENQDIVALWRAGGQALRAMLTGGAYTFGDVTPTHPQGLLHARGTGNGNGEITLPSGRLLLYGDLTMEVGERGPRYRYYDPEKRRTRDLYGAKVIQNVVQAVARDVLVWQAMRFTDATGLRMALTVHDELVYIVKHAMLEQSRVALRLWMSTAPPWALGLPLRCEDGTGPNYGSV